MTNFKILIILFLFIGFTACQKTEIEKDINNLEEQVDTALENIEKLEKSENDTRAERAEKVVEKLSPYFGELKGISKQSLIALSNCIHKEDDRESGDDLEELEKDLQFSRQQLSALEKQIKAKELSDMEAKKYFNDEQIVANRLFAILKQKKAYTEYLDKQYDLYLEKGEAVVDSLSQIK